MPKISVLMGVYNCAPYVGEAIESVLSQSFSDFEFIICDDGSKDETKEKVRPWAEKDKRIVFLENDANHGLAYTLNRCMNAASGEYFVRMDGDDVSLPNRFEILLQTAQSHPDFAVIGTGVDLFDENGIWGEVLLNYVPDRMEAFLQHTLAHASAILHASALRDVGGYRTECDAARAEDYDLWCRMVEKDYRLMSIPDKLYLVRWDRKNYYTRRPLRTRLAWAKLVRYWHKRFRFGMRGMSRVISTYLKAFVPNSLKSVYHHLRLHSK